MVTSWARGFWRMSNVSTAENVAVGYLKPSCNGTATWPLKAAIFFQSERDPQNIFGQQIHQKKLSSLVCVKMFWWRHCNVNWRLIVKITMTTKLNILSLLMMSKSRNNLTLFRMGIFGAAHGWGGGKKTPTLPKNCDIYPTIM